MGSSEALVAQWVGAPADPSELRRLLTDAERERHDRLQRATDRRDYLAAHVLVRLLAVTVDDLYLDGDVDCTPMRDLTPLLVGARAAQVEFEQRCPTCRRTGHGRPTIVHGPDLAVSWAHADGVVAAAVTPGRTSALGIDVERVGDATQRAAGVSTAVWCRMECAVKAGLTDLDAVLARGVPPTPGLHWTERAVDLAGGPTQVTVLAPEVATILVIGGADPVEA